MRCFTVYIDRRKVTSRERSAMDQKVLLAEAQNQMASVNATKMAAVMVQDADPKVQCAAAAAACAWARPVPLYGPPGGVWGLCQRPRPIKGPAPFHFPVGHPPTAIGCPPTAVGWPSVAFPRLLLATARPRGTDARSFFFFGC